MAAMLIGESLGRILQRCGSVGPSALPGTKGGSHLDAHGPLWIDDEDTSVSIEVTGVAGQEQELLEAFGECQAGQCSCPTGEYQKLASMDVQHAGDVIRIRLEPKAGQVLDTRLAAACLDYTTATASGAMDDEPRGPKAGS